MSSIISTLMCQDICFKFRSSGKNRLGDDPILLDGRNLYASVDGTDYPINEANLFKSTWFSHKFHGPGLLYEIGISIVSGRMVLFNRPLRCCLYSHNKFLIWVWHKFSLQMNMCWLVVYTQMESLSCPINHKNIIPYIAVYVSGMRKLINGSKFLILFIIFQT